MSTRFCVKASKFSTVMCLVVKIEHDGSQGGGHFCPVNGMPVYRSEPLYLVVFLRGRLFARLQLANTVAGDGRGSRMGLCILDPVLRDHSLQQDENGREKLRSSSLRPSTTLRSLANLERARAAKAQQKATSLHRTPHSSRLVRNCGAHGALLLATHRPVKGRAFRPKYRPAGLPF
uniref:Uncharacterized protein n=1 Tax=Ixodes ricinus TaxID=34613 RepID=A0A6B0UYL0_IXORI